MARNTLSLTAKRLRAWALPVVVAASLAACASYSDTANPARALDAQTLGLNEQGSAGAAQAGTIDSQWWRALGDAQLSALVDRALANSPSLRLAQARLARVQAGKDAVHGAELPQVTASTDLTRQLFTANSIYPPPLGGANANTGDLRVSVGWELDFFGKNRESLEAAVGQERAAQADAQAARVLLASSVARSYIALQRITAQLAVAERTLAQRSQTKALVQDRVNAGLDTQLELQQSDGALPEARLQIETLNEQRALALNALASLTAQPLANLHLDLPAQIASSPAAVAQSIPLDLLGRRADIVAARWRIEAASHDVAVAKTLFYPDINLAAFAGFNSIGFDKLLQSGSEQRGVGPAGRLPLFEGGGLRANLRGKKADLDLAIENYNALVIEAVHDVADQLTSVKAIASQQREQAAAQASAESAYAIATQRYQAGLGNYLNVLSAETTVLTQRRLAVDLAARALDTHVQLVRALGGGYQTATEAHTSQAPTTQKSKAQS